MSTLVVPATTRRDYIREVSQASLGRRSIGGRVAIVLCGLALGIALVPIISIVIFTISKGISAWSLQFFTNTPRPEGIAGGGIVNAILGALIIDGIAAAIALPVGFLAALFLAESEGRFAGAVRFVVDVASGLPAVTIGLFAYAVVVLPTKHFSGFSASIALAVLMLPITIRAGETAIRTVPRDLWEAGIALGIPRARVARSIVIPSAFPGLVTAALLAISRAVGEAAPLLFTAIGSQLFAVNIDRPMASLPLVVYLDGIQPYPDLQQTAWGTALTLLVIVVLLNVSARLLARRMRRYAQ
ncbi:MAG TPA: phosphate ABC transporter permease PstA [Candidatus Dormibacteraeota bacterium]|nr:phosphate ABC transporter permease PstA [Candidatus Dormibacteraeota bacterium]